MPATKRVLILGGTTEALALASRLAEVPDLTGVYSLAGVTERPADVPIAHRVGGFGGPEGLAAYLRRAHIDCVVDGTHPYAVNISRSAAIACWSCNVPRLYLARPPWTRVSGDRWIQVGDERAAVLVLPALGQRVFLSLGHRSLERFLEAPDIHYLVRSIDPPAEDLSGGRVTWVAGRGPFFDEGERALIGEQRIEAVVSRNSGGDATYPKIRVARELGLPVVMIARPAAPLGTAVSTVDAALRWLHPPGS